ncbi:MAG: hypothetical protein KIS77_06015 [Saprospiraceae bacterium]|nr:hypothetical protein [Saprospiraceae bacterium]
MRKLMTKSNDLEVKNFADMKRLAIFLFRFFTQVVSFFFVVMSKPICLLAPLLLSAFCILLFACEKEKTSPTVINGKVTDKKTGEPIEGAAAIIDFTIEKNVSGSIKTEHKTVTLSTDAQGEFHYTHDEDFDGIYSEVRKGGYVPRHI